MVHRCHHEKEWPSTMLRGYRIDMALQRQHSEARSQRTKLQIHFLHFLQHEKYYKERLVCTVEGTNPCFYF
jgi:hypothetical protein